MLRIRARYCSSLIVPLIDRLLLGLLQAIDTDGAAQLCYAVGRVPLVADVALEMQSDARFHGS